MKCLELNVLFLSYFPVFCCSPYSRDSGCFWQRERCVTCLIEYHSIEGGIHIRTRVSVLLIRQLYETVTHATAILTKHYYLYLQLDEIALELGNFCPLEERRNTNTRKSRQINTRLGSSKPAI